MDGMPSPLALLNAGLRWLFGGSAAYRQAFDMMRRLRIAYPAVVAVVTASFLPGLFVYDGLAAVPMIAAGAFYFGAITLPRRSRQPELISVIMWLLGLASSLFALAVAGPPYAYLWAGPAVSLPFIAVIWPPRATLAATVAFVAGSVVVANWLAPDDLRENPAELVGPILGFALVVGLAASVREIDRRHRNAVVTDALTGLGNRAALDGFLTDLRFAPVVPQTIAACVFDVDRFKALNDEYGHATGDAVLRRVADAMASALPDDACLFRTGGEELVVLMPDADEESGRVVADAIRARVAGSAVAPRPVTVSGGVAACRFERRIDLPALLRSADAALYEAKRQGRDRVIAAGPGTQAHLAAARRRQTPVITADEPATTRRDLRLVRNRIEREHLRTTAEMLLTMPGAGIVRGCVVAGSLALVPWLGWSFAVPAFLGVLAFQSRWQPVVKEGAYAERGGERIVLWQAVAGMTISCAAIAFADEPALYLLPVLVLSAFPAIVSYRAFGSVLVAAIGVLLMLATGLFVDASAVADNPLIVTLPMGLLGLVTIVGIAMARSTMEHAALAHVDPLTGALNRGALEARITELERVLRDDGEPVTLIVADLDHFKRINDTYGHEAGDEVLVDVARRMQEELRLVDVLYRIGGEEFVVLLPRTGRLEAEQIAERLRQAISERPCGGRPLTASLGLASFEAAGFEYAPAFDRADAALLEAKELGRNQVCVASAL